MRRRKHFSLRSLLGATVMVLALAFALVDPWEILNHDHVRRTHALSLDPDTSMVYLSDLEYDPDRTNVGYASVTYDRNLETRYNNGLIALNVDGNKKLFIKGIVAHSNSNVVYNLTDLTDFAYFTAYLGNDASRGANGDGLRFTIAVSNDGDNWEDRTPAEVQNVTFKGENDAVKVKVEISGYKYLRLSSQGLRNITADHASYGDAKLIKADYVETDTTVDFIKPVAEYDALIQNTALDQQLANNELTILQRAFVQNIGYDLLQTYASYNQDYYETLDWILHDETALRYYITGGAPIGGYVNSLKVLVQLYQAYKTDLEDTQVTSQNVVLGDLYLRMMIAISLTHSASVPSWIGGGQYSDPIKRYQIYKDLHSADLLENRIFETLNVENMRWVVNSMLTDEELPWLNAYARRFPVTSGSRKAPYNREPYIFIRYTFGYNYSREIYYDLAKQTEWDDKYALMAHGVPYGTPGKPKLWMVFEEGAVCGGTSKTGANLNAAFGWPSAVIGQPGHAAYLEYWQTDDGQGYWGIQNNISGWTASEKSERLLAGWGSNNWDSYYQVSYVPYAQNALNDLDNYNKALETLLLADSYPNDFDQREQIYRQALSYQSIHMNAWYNLIRLYQADSRKTEEDFLRLAREIAANLYYYPLPMFDLLNLIKPSLTTTSGEARLLSITHNALEEGTKVNADSGLLQPGITTTMANYLLGHSDTSVASFSFDGGQAGQIVLADRFQESGEEIYYEYSLDGQKTWTQTRDAKHQLTTPEIASINAENDIIIHFVGAAPDNIFVIDITEQNAPDNIYNNDIENRVIGASDVMEWRMDGENAWTSFAAAQPDLSGDKTVWVRYGAHATSLTGPEISLSYTEDVVDVKSKYVPVNRLSIAAVSSEATAQGRHATNAIDGNMNTNWHSAWNGSDTERYITVKFDAPLKLTAMDYIPGGGGNGRVLDGKVEISLDGQNWQLLEGFSGWANNDSTKTLRFQSPQLAQYVRFTGTRTSSAGGGSFMTAKMLNFYEDATELPTASISYSPSSLTNQNVTATLEGLGGSIHVVNNDGNGFYVFQNNGEFTFEIENYNGLKNYITAKVDWIDRVAPSASIEYANNPDGSVTARLVHEDEEIVMLGSGVREHTFASNGQHMFEFRDLAGNVSQKIAQVDWITASQPEQPSNPEKPSTPNTPNIPVTPEKPSEPSGNRPSTDDTSSTGDTNSGQGQNSSSVTTPSGNVTVDVAESNDTSGLTLGTKDLALTESLKQKFGEQSEYFSVYFVDTDGNRVATSLPVTMQIKLKDGQEFTGVYQVLPNGSTKTVDYVRVNDKEIRITAPNTGDYLVAYAKPSGTTEEAVSPQGVSESTKDGANLTWLWWIGGGIIFIIMVGLIGGAASNRRR